ncbi:MAG TPA: hypothetical protein PKC28_04585, partial [Bdellovibrionales bacterium]|nr:hypothetical protein [Bdellovibrionales bacterium]
TYGHDHAKWSFFDFGPVYKHLAKALAERGVHFHPVLGLGAGPLVEVAGRARKFIENHYLWKDPDARVHIFGHSAGGLIARLLMRHWGDQADEKVLSYLTIATPHRGTSLAQACVDMPNRHRRSAMFLRGFGYDVRSKRDFFHELTPEGIGDVFGGLQDEDDSRFASIVCALPRSGWCLPLRSFYAIPALNQLSSASDGVVDRDSQPYGEVLAEIPIDHFRQVGLFGERARFDQMMDVTTRFFKSC